MNETTTAEASGRGPRRRTSVALLVAAAAAVTLVAVMSAVSASTAGAEPIPAPRDEVPLGGPCETPPDPFSDVATTHAFCSEITWLSASGITGGFADGTFQPGQKVSRQGMAAFLWRLAGEPAPDDPAHGFSDVPATSPFGTAIAWMVEEGITGGFSDGTFRPRQAVSRQSMAAFLWRYEGEPAPDDPAHGFSDVAATSPFGSAIAWMVERDITGGFPDGTFRPGAPVTRQGMAAFLYRFVVTPDPTHCGTLTEDETWDASQVHVITCPVTIPEGINLEVRRGAVIKSSSNSLSVAGTFTTHGTPDHPTVLTSIDDDSHGGDTGDRPAGDYRNWTIPILPGGTTTIDHTLIRYGRLNPNGTPACVPNPPHLTVTDTTFDNADIYSICTDLSVTDSTLGDRSNIRVDDSTSPVITGLTVEPLDDPDQPGNLGPTPIFLVDITDPSGIRDNTFQADDARGAIWINGIITIPDGTTWTLDPATTGPTYLVNGPLTIDAGGTLTTQPDTIIKMRSEFLSVAGTFTTHGTPDHPTVLTSVADNEHGGTTPHPTYPDPTQATWTIPILPGGTTTIDHTLIRYGIIQATDATVGLSNLEIADDDHIQTLVRSDGGSLEVSDSAIETAATTLDIDDTELTVTNSTVRSDTWVIDADGGDTGISLDEVEATAPTILRQRLGSLSITDSDLDATGTALDLGTVIEGDIADTTITAIAIAIAVSGASDLDITTTTIGPAAAGVVITGAGADVDLHESYLANTAVAVSRSPLACYAEVEIISTTFGPGIVDQIENAPKDVPCGRVVSVVGAIGVDLTKMPSHLHTCYWQPPEGPPLTYSIVKWDATVAPDDFCVGPYVDITHPVLP
jgi:hypothetical protein